MNRNPRVSSSSGRRRNVVKPGRIDTILGHDRQGLRLNFGLAMHQQRSYTVPSSGRGGAGGSGGGSGHRQNSRGAPATNADSSEPLTHSGSLSQSQGTYSQGMMYPSQGISLSQGSVGQMGHQSQSENAGFAMSQPSPDILAPYASTHHSHDGGGGVRTGRLTLGRGSGIDGGTTGRRELQPAELLRGAGNAGNANHRNIHDSRLPSSSVASAKARRPQPLPRDGERQRGQAHRPSSHSGSSNTSSRGRKGVGGVVDGRGGTTFAGTAGSMPRKGGFGSETAAIQAFERLLSEQFRTQVMSELSGLRTLVETTREDFVDQAKGNSKNSTALRGLQQGLQETRDVAQVAKDTSSKALQVLENTVPKAFLSLETRLRRAEDTLAGMKEMIAATLASAEKAVAASTEAASAASAAAASMSEAIARGNRSSRGVDSGRLGSALRLPSQSQPQPLLLQQQQQVDVRQHRVRQLEPKTLASGKTDVPSLVGAHQHRQPGGRKRKNGGYLQQHQHAPPAATLRQTECDGRHDDGSEVRLGGADLPESKERPDTCPETGYSPQQLDGGGEVDESMQWQGVEESLRWTQPWGGVATATSTRHTTTAGAATPDPGHQAERPETQSLIGRAAPTFCGTSSGASNSCSSPDLKKIGDRVGGPQEEEIAILLSSSPPPSPSTPPLQQDLDSYNPFYEEDLVPVTVTSSGKDTSKKVGGHPSLSAVVMMPNTLRTPSTVAVQPPPAGGAGGRLSAASSSPVAEESRTTDRSSSRPPSPFSAPIPTTSVPATVTTGTAGIAARSSLAPRSRSSHTAMPTAKARQGATGVDSGNFDAQGTPRSTTRLPQPGGGVQRDQTSPAPWPTPPVSAAASACSRSRRPSADHISGKPSGNNGHHHREERSAPNAAPTVQQQPLAPSLLASSSGRTSRRTSTSHDDGNNATRRTTGKSSRDAAHVGRGGATAVTAAPAAAAEHGTGRHPRCSVSRSEPVTLTDRFGGVDRRATPVPGNGMGAASRSSSVLSPSQEGDHDDEEEEEDSFGGPGLTVEAYMATKKRRYQPNRSQKTERNSAGGGTSTSRNAPSARVEATAGLPDLGPASSSWTKAAGATALLTRPPPLRRRATASTSSSSSISGNSQGGGKRARSGPGERESNGDSWLVGGGSGW